MKLSEFKHALEHLQEMNFELPDGKLIPAHFHITEIGINDKHFIDCGGTIRKESVINFQILDTNDLDHRLLPGKLIAIISQSEKALDIKDAEVEVEYQTDTIGKYELGFNGRYFVLISKHTACLPASGRGEPNTGVHLSKSIKNGKSCCALDNKCC